MNATAVINEMGRTKHVENLVRSVMHVRNLSPTLEDLAQMIYESLLRTDPARIVRLWVERDEQGQRQMDFYVVAIIKRQTQGDHSSWRETFIDYDRRHVDIHTRAAYQIADE